MALLERKRVSKWHKQITATVREITPSEAVSKDVAIFPYAQVHAFTKDYLGKRKRSQIEKDRALVDLIYGHPRTEVAFASCAEALSEDIVEQLLSDLFPVDSVTLYGLEAYLQAFVAAAHSKEGLFLPSDLAFANSIVPVTRDVVQQHITHTTAEKLFQAWTSGPPCDRVLLSRAKLLSRIICQRVSSDLANRRNSSACAKWTTARDYSKAVSLLRRTCIDVEHILHSTWPAWRSWASWNPDRLRLQAWASLKTADMFGDLQDLDGPSLNDHLHGTEWQALVRKGHLVTWLASRFRLGPGLVTDDSQEHLASFVQRLLNTVVVALQKGSVYSQFLRALIDNQGLDWQPLVVWEGAVSRLSSDFIELLATCQMKEDSDIVLVRGLQALSADQSKANRAALAPLLGKCILGAAEQTQLSFLARFASGQLWLPNAKRLWTLRDAIVKADWLHKSIDGRLLTAARSQTATRTALPRVNELQQAIASTPVLEVSVDVYVQRFVLDGAVARDDTTTVPQVLHTLFCCTERVDVRDTGITIASLASFNLADRILCIRQLLHLSTELAQKLHGGLLLLPQREHVNFITLTGLVKSVVSALNSDTTCWSNLLRWAFEAGNFRLSSPEFTSMPFKDYAQWITDLKDTTTLPGLDSIYTRIVEFKQFETFIERMESSGMDIATFLLEADESDLELTKYTFSRLKHLIDAGCERMELLYSIIVTTCGIPETAEGLDAIIQDITELDDHAFATCEELVELKIRGQDHVASSLLTVWLTMSCFDTTTKHALVELANLLGIQVVQDDDGLPNATIEAAKCYYEGRVAAFVEMARTLEVSRKALQTTTNKDEITSTLSYFGIEQPTLAAAIIADLPDELLDYVDEAEEDVVELHFPLSSPSLSSMERLGFGLKGSEMLTVLLRIGLGGEVQDFCVHVVNNNDNDTHIDEHNFTAISSASTSSPDSLTCTGRQNRLTYLIARLLWRHIRAAHHNISLQDLYAKVQQALHTGAWHCMVCSNAMDVRLHRPTICSDPECGLAYRRAHRDVRLEDVRSDSRVVDLLLSSVYAASFIGTMELLPNKPSTLGTPKEVVELLNSLPDTKALAKVDIDTLQSTEQKESLFSWLSDIFPGFRRPGSVVESAGSSKVLEQAVITKQALIRQVETSSPSQNTPTTPQHALNSEGNSKKKQTSLLLSWLCNNYRGFVISATDTRYRIPAFAASVQQFLLVDAPPEVEAAFAQHDHLVPRNLLFHGTSMDRLYSVLCQGLRVLSGTALQKHGAAYGPGIYFAREPALAMSFSSRTAGVDGNTSPSFFTSRPDFKNCTVLLGCEHAGNDENIVPGGRRDVHVITDPSRVMVRYIWIVPHGTLVPRAQDLRIPMLSVFAEVRSGLVEKMVD